VTSIESNNLHFVIESDFLLDSSNTKLVRYLAMNQTSSFLVMLKFFVHHAFHIVNHFHQFHLKQIPN
jgi:hypothetical protein